MHATWNKSDVRDYRSAQKERLGLYAKTDEILYDMCRRWPDHDDLGAVNAKVRVIGRVYAAGLERKAVKDVSHGIYERVSEILFKERNWIDPRLAELRKFKRLSTAACEEILSVHGSMVKLLKLGTRSKLNFRSFVSKYVHFHVAIVPIFDSRASKTINRSDWYPWREFKSRLPIVRGKGSDPVYFKFVRQFMLYFQDLQELKLRPSVRAADYYLIWSAS